ncbi:sigma-70 family RNA polymerase sigma factor [Arthrobacter sp. ISL-65]|uniref:sigma-70 family RNA polymerase sigma factor n=1 Tax=Arthrobacter sp. ISL-65 TaxID=2819112 RepID=UPI001BE78293|nr:sigma-70 family RNA polymerase sigma factor [Arthrobacter sp. ISL-65]MBT2547142.1 sigma-70 family RNA polymerase sigma factor [Arthrobacter sp. ISL-65]
MPETPPSLSVTGPPRAAPRPVYPPVNPVVPQTGQLHDAFQNQLVLNYLDLAESLASRFAARGRERSDLVQVAYLGLIKAARGFDEEKGESFPAYAAPTISGELKRFLRDRCWTVRPPRRIQDVRTQLLHTAPDLAQSLGRVPSAQELASELGVTPADVREAQAAGSSMHPDSLDSPDPWGGPTMGEGLVSPDQPIEHLEELVCLHEAIQELDPDDREMLYRRYFREETQVELGKRFGISQMQVSRRLSRILVWLQRRLLDEEDGDGGSARSARAGSDRASADQASRSCPTAARTSSTETASRAGSGVAAKVSPRRT